MSFLIVGSFKAIKGAEYQAIVTKGNAFRIMEEVRFSINRGEFAKMPVNEDILTHPEFTYSPEEDTVVLLTKVTPLDLSVDYINQCPTDIPLSNGAESSEVCAVLVPTLATRGFITASAYVDNSGGSDIDITINVYLDAILYETYTTPAYRQNGTVVVLYKPITTDIPLGSIVSFKLTAAGNNCIIKGTTQPSSIVVEQRNI